MFERGFGGSAAAGLPSASGQVGDAGGAAGSPDVPADPFWDEDLDVAFAEVMAGMSTAEAGPEAGLPADDWRMPTSGALDRVTARHVAALLDVVPGGVLAAAVEDASDPGVTAELPDSAVVGLAVAAHRLAAWAAGVQVAAMAELHARYIDTSGVGIGDAGLDGALRERARGIAEDLGPRAVVAEVGLACGMSEYAAGQRLDAALALANRLPATRAALLRGEVDWPKAQAIVAGTAGLPHRIAQAVEATVLPAAVAQNLPALRRALAEAVLACDPAGADQRVQDVRRDRRVVFTPVADGMSELWALLPAVAAARARAGLECAAREAAAPGDDRTADQRRADTLVDLLAGGGAGPGDADAGSRGGSRARCGPPMQVVVTLPMETLLAKSDSPGYLNGYGPIPARMARDAAAEGTWRCAVVDGVHGTLLGLGRATYTPGYRAGVSAERHIEVRDRTCTFPGCHQPARRCDADHRVKHPGGATCECNLQSLCRHHHRLKHRGGFRVGTTADPNLPPGTLSWATPAGFRHFRPPTRLGRPMAKAPPSDTGDPPPF